MKAATGMFYYLSDRYKTCTTKICRASSRSREGHVKRLFEGVRRRFNPMVLQNATNWKQYIKSVYSKNNGLQAKAVRQMFYRHREFLMKSMLEGQEGLSWEISPILRHFKKIFPV